MKATILAISETEVERLGRYAAECDLWAADPQTTPWERTLLAERAENYRSQQVLLFSGLHKCGSVGCLAMVAGTQYCLKCEEEQRSVPYTFATLLGEFPRWSRWWMGVSFFVGAAVFLALAMLVL